MIASQSKIILKDTTLYQGLDSWTPQDNFVAATNADGADVPFADLKITNKVNLDVLGKQEVTYSFVDATGKTIEARAVVTVVENQQSLEGTDYTMKLGDKTPTAADFGAKATDKTGATVQTTASFDEVDFTKAGTYPVMLKTTDGQSMKVHLKIVDVTTPDTGDTNEPSSGQGFSKTTPTTETKEGMRTNQSSSTVQSKRTLPKTGTKATEVLTTIGLMVIITIAGLFVRNRKKVK